MKKYKLNVEALISWISEVNELLKAGAILVVEGKKDVSSLKNLGIQDNIMTLNTLKSLMRSRSDFIGYTFILLTDFDEEGSKIYNMLKNDLQSMGAKVLEGVRKGYRFVGLPPKVEESYNFVRKRVRHWREIKNFSLR